MNIHHHLQHPIPTMLRQRQLTHHSQKGDQNIQTQKNCGTAKQDKNKSKHWISTIRIKKTNATIKYNHAYFGRKAAAAAAAAQ